MRALTSWLIVLTVVAVAGAATAGELSFQRGRQDDRPEIFQKADPAIALMAEEIARQDAWSKIAEMVAGMEVRGGVSVRDLSSGAVQYITSVKANIKGMRDADVKYYDVGIVQIKVEVVWRELIEQIELYIRKNGGQIDADSFIKYNLTHRDKTLAVWGSGALPGSEGVEIVKALRAAEVAASAQLLTKVEGVEVARDTTVKDFVLASDAIRSCLLDSVKNVQYVDYRVLDRTVEVDAELEVGRTIERIERTYQDLVAYDRCTGCPTVTRQWMDSVTKELVTDTFNATGKAVIAGSGIATNAPADADAGDFELEATFEKRSGQGLVSKP